MLFIWFFSIIQYEIPNVQTSINASRQKLWKITWILFDWCNRTTLYRMRITKSLQSIIIIRAILFDIKNQSIDGMWEWKPRSDTCTEQACFRRHHTFWLVTTLLTVYCSQLNGSHLNSVTPALMHIRLLIL